LVWGVFITGQEVRPLSPLREFPPRGGLRLRHLLILDPEGLVPKKKQQS